MNVTVRFFASLREAVGEDDIAIELAEGNRITDLLANIRQRVSPEAWAEIAAENVKIAVNQALVTGEADLADGDEVAFLPPVTGG